MNHRIALVGNPNCGKTTLFNKLTGSNQYVGNWPGVTVEKKEGEFKYNDETITLVDLPGIYSLSPYTMEEIVTRDYILNEKPDGIINIVDGTNIERNLYLSIQLMELGRPVVIAVNMMDDVEAKGEKIDCEKLSYMLGVPVVPIVAKKGENIDGILKFTDHMIHFDHNLEGHNKFDLHNKYEHHHMQKISANINYDKDTQNAINNVISVISDNANMPEDTPWEFFATKILENDHSIFEKLKLSQDQMKKIDEIMDEYVSTSKYGDKDTLIADARYAYITKVTALCVKKSRGLGYMSTSDKIDSVLTNKYLAIPVFLLIMLVMFSLTFGTVGEFLVDKMEYLINNVISGSLLNIMDKTNTAPFLQSLVIDGIIAGVGGVLVFLPQISILFFFLSILEDSGYMSRAAFIMDRPLRKLGLTGKSFIPMLMGFGCTTPAVMAARTMENENDRKMTIMLTPFMSCGAKLPIYALFTGLFFERYKGLVVFSMYLIGMIVAIIYGVILKKTMFKGEAAPFVMELPPYRMPSPASVLRHTWEKAKGFIIKAGTIIFAMSIVIWFLQNFDFTLSMVSNSSDSIFASMGKIIAPIFIPLGFGIWQSVAALLTGIIAKEAVVTTMNVLFGSEMGIASAFTPLSAYTFMVFALLYMPCMAAFVTMRKELGSLSFAVKTVLTQTLIAYFVALIVHTIGIMIV